MVRVPSRTRRTMLFCLLALLVGCGEGAGGSAVEVPELGLSMKLPPGWRARASEPRMFYDGDNREDNFGMVEDYPLEGLTLEEYVEKMSKAGAPQVLSKTPCTVGGCEAVEMVTEAEYAVVEVDIRKGDRVIRVSFRTLAEDLPEHEESFRAALRSIAIN